MAQNFSSIAKDAIRDEGEAGGIGEVDQSLLASVGPLLRFYSWVGLFPASISRDYKEFKVGETLPRILSWKSGFVVDLVADTMVPVHPSCDLLRLVWQSRLLSLHEFGRLRSAR